MKRLLFLFSALLALSAADLRAASPCGTKPSESLVSYLVTQAPGLKSDVMRLALQSAACATQNGLVKRRDLITVIDYSIPSTEPRLFTFDLSKRELLYREHVAHGKNSGGNIPTIFSNRHGSLATSLGLFVTADTYFGSNGYSLRLRGLEKGVNDNAWDRAIVMHGANYVSSLAIRAFGRLGRSWGCPAVRAEVSKKLINTIKGGSPIFAYYPDRNWLAQSRFLPKAKVRIARAETGKR
jgi:hypothetical protein